MSYIICGIWMNIYKEFWKVDSFEELEAELQWLEGLDGWTIYMIILEVK